MMKPHLLVFSLGIMLGALAGPSCSGSQQFSGECQSDDDCPVGFDCRAGLCYCRGPESCEEGQFCNDQGLCQLKAGCRTNGDCEDTNKFCDIETGDCIDRTSCASDVHCGPGTVCNRQTQQCINGCRDTADCPLGAICERAAGVPETELGGCFYGRCDGKSFCNYGENCINGSCVPDNNPVHCAACTNMRNDCGGAGNNNYCLINANYDPNDPTQGSQYFCGVECSAEDDCPNGYRCGPVQLLTQDLCTPGNDAQCGSGRRCIGGEGDRLGACTCANDNDCAIDSIPPSCVGTCGGLGLQPCTNDNECLSFCDLANKSCQGDGSACNVDGDCAPTPFCRNGICLTDGSGCTTSADCLCAPDPLSGVRLCVGTGRPCSTGADCQLTCQQGACLLGFTCAPDEGLSCQDLP